MKLSILIATQGRRNSSFKRVLKELNHQLQEFKGKIELVAYWNNGELPIGKIRQDLIDEAKGEYICFVDDDDFIPPYYCREIMKALGKDYVGFEVQLFDNEVHMKPVYHNLEYPNWHEDDDGYYRDITHLNPIKRSIAHQGEFSLQGMGEDVAWAASVRHLTKTQNYIDKPMYYYYHDRRDSSFGGDWKHRYKVYTRPTIRYANFRWHPDSKLIKEV